MQLSWAIFLFACLESDVMRALEHRQGDKLAREFVKRQKAKLAEIKQNGNK